MILALIFIAPLWPKLNRETDSFVLFISPPPPLPSACLASRVHVCALQLPRWVTQARRNELDGFSLNNIAANGAAGWVMSALISAQGISVAVLVLRML